MDDLPGKVRRGPPTLKDGEPSKEFCIRVPMSDFEKARALAEKHRVSVASIFRSAFRVAVKRQTTLDG